MDGGLAQLPGLLQSDGRTPLGANRDLGAEILGLMVTSGGTKEVLSEADMLARLDAGGHMRQEDAADRTLVERTRLGLERVRLLCSFRRDGEACYELAHDHLAAEVARRLGEADLQAKLAQEMLRREVDNWRGAGLLIREEVFDLVHEQRDMLSRLTPDEIELLLRTASAMDVDADYWFDRAWTVDVAAEVLWSVVAESDSFRLHTAAVMAMASAGDRYVTAM